MDANIVTQARFYRRGLVLGFTLAEISILIIFMLLLVLAAILKSKEDKIKELERTTITMQTELRQRRQTDADNKAQIKVLEEKLLNSETSKVNQFDDLFRELHLAQQKAKQLEQRVPGLEEKTKVMEQIEAQLLPPDLAGDSPPEAKLAWLTARVRLAEQMAQAVRKAGLPADTPQATFAEVEKLLHSIPRNAQRTLEGAGKGTEHPACWVSPETGNPEYIFDIALTSTGIIIWDNALPRRAEEQSQLPLRMMVFGEEFSLGRFLAASLPLFEWSVKHECRFFVRVFDRTKVDEKDIYKRHLRTVGQRFYHYEDLSAKF